MARTPIDVDGVLRAITVPPAGWRKARLVFGVPDPDQRGFEGLVGPDTVPWEITFRWRGIATALIRKHAAEHIARQQVAGYAFRLVELDDEWLIAERFVMGTQLRVWDGIRPLDPLGRWHVDGYEPTQATLVVVWTHPGGLTVEHVTLYARYRSHGFDDALWTGHVQRFDSNREGHFGFLRCPWSPQLLPQTAPSVVPPPPPPVGLLAALQAPTPRPAVEAGFPEGEGEAAQSALFKKADAWLRAHGMDTAAWTGLAVPT